MDSKWIYDRQKTQEYIRTRIPYREILTEKGFPSVLALKDGSILSVFRLMFADDKMNSSIRAERSEQISRFLSKWGKEWSFYFDLFHTENIGQNSFIEDDTKIPPLARKICDTREISYYSDNVFYENEIYLAVQFHTSFSATLTSGNTLTTRQITAFLSWLEDIKTRFSAFDCELSELKDRELIAYCCNSVFGSIDTLSHFEPAGKLDVSISKHMDCYLDHNPFVVNERVCQTITIKDLPIYTSPDFFSSFSSLPFPFRIFLKIDCRNSEQSRKFIQLKRAEHSKGIYGIGALLRKATGKSNEIEEADLNLESLYGKKGCEEALYKQQETGLTAPLMFLVITLKGENEEQLEEREKSMFSLFSSLDCEISVEKELNFLYFSYCFTGNTAKEELGMNLFTDSISDFISCAGSDWYSVSKHLSEITKSNLPFLTCEHITGALRCFSPSGRYGNYGHTFITGMTGSGKSIMLNLWGNEWLKYDNTRLVYIDMGLSCLKTVLFNNGQLFTPSVDKTCFAPLCNAKKRESAVLHFFESVMEANNKHLSSEDRLNIDSILNILPEDATLSLFMNLYKGSFGEKSDFVEVMKQYTDIFKGLFDNSTDSFSSLPRVMGIELEPLFSGNSQALTLPSLIYLLDRLEEGFTGENPCLLILDEAWKYLKMDYFANYIRNWLKTLRKKNVFVVIATQELDDLLTSDIANTIIENCWSRVFIQNSRADEPKVRECYEKLGLQDYQIDIIRKIPKFTCCVLQDDSFSALNFHGDFTINDLKVSVDEKQQFLTAIKEM